MSGEYTHEPADEVLCVTDLGKGLQLKASRKIDFNKKRALWLLEEVEEFLGDRRLRQAHVDYLVKTMQRGTFHPEWVHLIVCDYKGKTWRMNGQHTAWARLEMPDDWPCAVMLQEYIAKSEQDMRILYSSIDRSAARTKANVIHSYLKGTNGFADIPAWIMKVLTPGFSVWQWQKTNQRRQHDGDDIAYLLQTDFYELAMRVGGFLKRMGNKECGHVKRAPVVGAMFATFQKAPRIAHDFWAPVILGTGIDSTSDPRMKLRNSLQAVSMSSGSRTGKRYVSQEAMFRMCIFAWNAFREDKPMQLLKTSDVGNRPKLK